ncbi:NTPase KAP family P-loop domain-containing protein 1 [Chanos chanos]|uniref:NTPase KAP family P-loop domain-containing protein 1 n=1 Tax=Chanos chanos TaxID=29144 RepID=A0A6J2V6K2_CHACN|nr:NTPase KAP family P-loop domain-containing protein 1-like [Chanos chanos]
MLLTDIPSDNIYAHALCKTLTKVPSPLTVGLYSSCHNRINMILRNIEIQMEQEAERREQKYQGRSTKPSFINFVSLITRLLFFRPVWTEEDRSRKNVRYVFVRFSAWHFAGSDLLWAGLIMRLCQAFEKNFGKLQLALFRVAQYDEEKDFERKKTEDSINNWRSKKVCCFPLWAVVLVTFIITLFIFVPILILGFIKSNDEGKVDVKDGEDDGFGALEGFIIASLGVPAVGAARFSFLIGKNLILNQDINVKKVMDNQKVSEQLGLMYEIRKEMRLLSCFVHFLEVFERRKIRVVLEITNLDRCTPKKIVGVLDAINILLSDEESPFISLLAVDPEVLVQQVDHVESCFSKTDRAFSFLDRIITLPFTVPSLCNNSKCKVFWNIVCGQSEIPEDFPLDEIEPKARGSPKVSLSIEDDTEAKNEPVKDDSLLPLTAKNQRAETYVSELNEEEIERLIQSAFEEIILSNSSTLHHYISEDTMSMRRVINSIRMSILIMEALKTEPPPTERIAAWVVLVDCWPCRLSWILQCIEDDQQRAKIDAGSQIDADETKTLWEVFSEHRVELHMIGNEVEKFLERDGDPELFEMFLKKDFRITVGEADRFKLSTVNLDHSIKKEMARIRGSTRLSGPESNSFNSLSARTVLNMTTEDICKELPKLNLPSKYTDVVRQNDLNGRTLLCSDPDDLRQVLQMTLGEWTTFKIHFLGLTPLAPSVQPVYRILDKHHQSCPPGVLKRS